MSCTAVHIAGAFGGRRAGWYLVPPERLNQMDFNLEMFYPTHVQYM